MSSLDRLQESLEVNHVNFIAMFACVICIRARFDSHANKLPSQLCTNSPFHARTHTRAFPQHSSFVDMSRVAYCVASGKWDSLYAKWIDFVR